MKVWNIPGVHYPADKPEQPKRIGRPRIYPPGGSYQRWLGILRQRREANIAAGLRADGGFRINKLRRDYIERHQLCK